MYTSTNRSLFAGVIVGLVCSFVTAAPVAAQDDLKEANCANPQLPNEEQCCDMVRQMGQQVGANLCRSWGFKPPAKVGPKPPPKETKASQITAQCAEFADQMGWHQSDLEREAAAERCRRKPDKFLGTDPGQALHGYWLSDNLKCDAGYIAENKDCVRLPEREGGTWTQSGRLGCNKRELYILVVDKRGVTGPRDLDGLAPGKQKCLKLREPNQGKSLTSARQIEKAWRPTVNCPDGYQYSATMDLCALL